MATKDYPENSIRAVSIVTIFLFLEEQNSPVLGKRTELIRPHVNCKDVSSLKGGDIISRRGIIAGYRRILYIV